MNQGRFHTATCTVYKVSEEVCPLSELCMCKQQTPKAPITNKKNEVARALRLTFEHTGVVVASSTQYTYRLKESCGAEVSHAARVYANVVRV